ncbi:MAG: hypothetical protein ACI90V_002798 [Bacillariaceae sp.]|jgi:hypothetical protein
MRGRNHVVDIVIVIDIDIVMVIVRMDGWMGILLT